MAIPQRGLHHWLQALVSESASSLHEYRSHLDAVLEEARIRFVEWVATVEEPVARPLLNLVNEEDRTRVAATLARDIAAYGRFRVEFRGATAGTTAIWYMVRGQAFAPMPEGRPIIAIVFDITEFKQAELALYENEEKFEAIVDSLNDAVLLHDGETGAILFVNATASELYGYGRETFQHLTMGNLSEGCPPYTGQDALECFARALHGKPQFFVWRAKDAHGHLFWVEIHARAVQIGPARRLLVVVRDIDAHKKANQALRESEERYRTLVDLSPDAIFVHRDGIMAMANHSAMRLFGVEREEQLLGLPWTARVDPAFHNTVKKQIQLIEGTAGLVVLPAMEQRYLQASGFPVEVEVTTSSIMLPEGRAVLSVARDITRRKTDEANLKTLLAQQEALLDNALVGIVLLENRIITQCNRRFEEMFGYEEGAMLGHSSRLLYPTDEDYRMVGERAYQALTQNHHYEEPLWLRHKSGALFWGCLHGRALDSTQPHAGSVWIFTDLTEQRRTQEQLAFLAHHDPLTGLPNRTFFKDRLAHAIRRAARQNTRLAVFFIDLDRFKEVNDTLGHPFGDQLLRTVAEELQKAVRACDTLARLGGDEFTLLIEDLDNGSDTAIIARKLLSIFEHPFALAEHELFISASIGSSFYPDDGRDLDDLIKNADAAMYQAKARGRNNYHLYAREMTASALEKLHLETLLRHSIENNELVVYFQPQVDMQSGALVGAEALVRWQHPELGLVSPATFIPRAEENGFITYLGEWVLRESCRKLQCWRAAGLKIPRISINLSIRQLEHSSLLESIAGILAKAGLPPECLEMEITESFIVEAEEAFRFLKALRALGVQLSIDDFGTGYSSLMYLKRLPIQKLKIDRSFVMDIGCDASNEAIVRTIIALANNLGLSVIAEGVETAEQRDFLLREGCPHGQGYYFDKPIPEAEFLTRWLC
ncbi:MAG: EAL domain-containing protein [Gammaproteobacteria bacterium]|nr:EAL domain-containing protein [Gammaproteobacteria bacterium]